jgi:hypothetical protein
MADQSITNLDPQRDDSIRYAVGEPNWRDPVIPGMRIRNTVALDASQVIDVIILGDGYPDTAAFEKDVATWIDDFYQVDVYSSFSGAFRVHALFNRSASFASRDRDSFYRTSINADGDVETGNWYKNDGTDNKWFREQVSASMARFAFNENVYPSSLDDGGDDRVIHNQLANLYSNLVVIMLVTTGPGQHPSGRTCDISLSQNRKVNISIAAYSLHEFGHGFAYLEDEYISTRGSDASRHNPSAKSIFTLSNLSFSDRLEESLWLHLSPWGKFRRQAAGTAASPIVGWLWRGGEADEKVWHSEYKCLMNGTHENYTYSSTEVLADGQAGANLRSRHRYCLWCREIVVMRILEKTGQLKANDDPSDINEKGKTWYQKWVSDWRNVVWDFFDVRRLIAEREFAYTPAELNLIVDGIRRSLWQSNLYKPFMASPQTAGATPAFGDDEMFIVGNG